MCHRPPPSPRRHALAHNTTQRRNDANHALHGACSVVGRPLLHEPKSTRAARHGVRTQCQQTFELRAADLSRCWCGRCQANRRRGEKCAPRWATTQPRQVRTTRHACSVGGLPILHWAKSAWAAYHGIHLRRPRPFEVHTSGLLRRLCGRVSASGVVGARPRWPATQPRQVRTARRVLRGPLLHGSNSARAARQGVRTRRLRFFADPSRWWCGRAPADGVGRSVPRQHTKPALCGGRTPRAVS